MQILISQLRFAAAVSSQSRLVVRYFWADHRAMLALGAVAAQDATKKDANKITIGQFTFTPKELTVAVGTTVKWVNHDDIRTRWSRRRRPFGRRRSTTDDSYSFTFTQRRHVRLFLRPHPHNGRQVIVK